MLHWGTFDTIGQHVFLRNFAAFVMTYFDALKVRTIRLDRLLRVNVITALTDSSCSYRLSGRLFILAILLSSVGVMQLHSLMYRVAWFLLWFERVPLFYLVALATPIASKPVQCTDLVDASESCWGGKKKGTAIRIGMWHDKSTNKKGGWQGGVGRCTYMVKPPGVFPERFIRAVGEGKGSQAGSC